LKVVLPLNSSMSLRRRQVGQGQASSMGPSCILLIWFGLKAPKLTHILRRNLCFGTRTQAMAICGKPCFLAVPQLMTVTTKAVPQRATILGDQRHQEQLVLKAVAAASK
jgi:hypothetical protein